MFLVETVTPLRLWMTVIVGVQEALSANGKANSNKTMEKARIKTGVFFSNHALWGKDEFSLLAGDIIERVALLIRYGTIRMAERSRVCGRWLAETGLSVGGICLGAFERYRDLSKEALATRSSFDFGMKTGWHVH
jgi:hypothetical protein